MPSARLKASLLVCLIQWFGALAGGGVAHAAAEYFVDPQAGLDQADRGSEARPWKTLTYASLELGKKPVDEQAGSVIKLRAGVVHPPAALVAAMRGTPERPIVIRPYGDGRAVIDAGEERFRQPGAWTRVPGRPDEWRSEPIATGPGEPAVWGLVREESGERFRLITYATLEDLRASNQSFHRVPLADPRDAFGPLADDPTRKIPFTYLGPGVHFVPESGSVGRVHLRLAATNLATPGIVDYPGGGDPNQMAISIALETSRALAIQSANVVLRQVTLQNGGDATLALEKGAGNIAFEHCEVVGGRHGVRIVGDLTGVRFEHCTFDGALPSWTTRSDVKDDYRYRAHPPCPTDDGTCGNGMGRMTHAILVIHAAHRGAYVNCTFRRAHDAIQVTGKGVDIDRSLFEDINDEAVQIRSGAEDLRVHRNVFRQVLHPVSFALDPSGGPVFFYRNVVDQRIPTRGYRLLPPDVPSAFVWRYGADFKDAPTLAFHAYQNTFITSHELDKASFASAIFARKPPVGFTYRNNIHIMLALDRVLGLVQPPEAGVVSEGNLWHRAHQHPEPYFRAPLFTSATGSYRSLAELWAAHPHWERDSQVGDPRLRNVSDESFDWAAPFPNSDFRPAPDSPAIGRGVSLPPELPDDFIAPGRPDVGARPADAEVMSVGVDGQVLFPAPSLPVAQAGPDQLLDDVAGDGFEWVSLDAAGSVADGAIVAFEWLLAGRVVATSSSARARLRLPEGRHHLQLVVTDARQRKDSDDVIVTVSPPSRGDNRLTCAGFEEGACAWSVAWGARIVETRAAHSGARALELPAGGAAEARQRVAVSPGRFLVSGWVNAEHLPSAGLEVRRLAHAGGVIDVIPLAASPGVGRWSYHAVELSVDAGTAFLELAARAGSGSGVAVVDDLRIRDSNRLENGGFERPSLSGSPRSLPGWHLERGGGVDERPYGGRRALQLSPSSRGGDYDLVSQTITHLPARGYRFSARLRTEGVESPPTFNVRFYDAQGVSLGLHGIAAATSEGVFSLVGADFPAAKIPARTAAMKVELRLAGPGTATFDDVLVEPLP